MGPASPEPVEAVLGLGSNLGDRRAHLQAAIRALRRDQVLTGLVTSPLYKSEPVGYLDQPWFLNAAVLGRTRLSPEHLLQRVKEIERAIGRTAGPRWGPRVIDLDILLYGDRKVSTPHLTVPHPRLSERLFVLLPLRDLRPDWQDQKGRDLDELIAAAASGGAVRLVAERGSWEE